MQSSRNINPTSVPLPFNNNVTAPSLATAYTMNSCLQLNKGLKLNKQFVSVDNTIKLNKNSSFQAQSLKISKAIVKIRKSNNNRINKTLTIKGTRHKTMKKNIMQLKPHRSNKKNTSERFISFIKNVNTKAAMIAGLIIAAIK